MVLMSQEAVTLVVWVVLAVSSNPRDTLLQSSFALIFHAAMSLIDQLGAFLGVVYGRTP